MSIAASANSQFDHSTDPTQGQPNREMVQTLREQSLHRLIAAAIVAGELGTVSMPDKFCTMHGPAV